MALFTDAVTIYNQVSDSEWKRTVVDGVQWSEKTDKQNSDGVLSIVQYASITFPKGTYEDLILDASRENDCIVYGVVEDIVTSEKGSRVSDLKEKYPKSGRIKSVNDNSNRRRLPNMKVVVG